MIKHIVVALDSVGQANSIAPYLLSVAQPGIHIVFLIPTKTRKAIWLQARMTALMSQHSLAVQVCEGHWEFEMNLEKRAAEQKLEALRLALLREGTTTEIWIYTSSLSKVLKHMERNYPSSFAVLRPRKDWLAEQFVRAILKRVGLCLTNGGSRASLAFSSDEQFAPWAENNNAHIEMMRSEKSTNT